MITLLSPGITVACPAPVIVQGVGVGKGDGSVIAVGMVGGVGASTLIVTVSVPGTTVAIPAPWILHGVGVGVGVIASNDASHASYASSLPFITSVPENTVEAELVA
jgi:hypothetical protein